MSDASFSRLARAIEDCIEQPLDNHAWKDLATITDALETERIEMRRRIAALERLLPHD